MCLQNSTHFAVGEFNTGSFPKGLSMMLGMLQGWIYDRSPVDHIRFEESLSAIKNDLAVSCSRHLFVTCSGFMHSLLLGG
jgi:Zn-dependent M16 (insulinase) family peptidase